MSIVIRIKRRIPVGAGDQLKPGELAYSEGSGTLYLGNGAETVNLVIGGDFFTDLLSATPGVATADKAAILDSNIEIDSWNVAGLLTAETFKTSAAVAAGFVKNDGSGNFLFGQTGEQTDLFLDNLADVTITSETLGDFLRFDGSVFVNTPLSASDLPTHTHVEADITDLQNYSLVGHTHVEADITDLQNYSLVGHTHVEADITDLQAYLLDITGESIDDLSDVDTTGISTGDHLTFNGTNWVPVTNDFIGLADTPPDYSGAGLLFLRVDSGVSFVEFVSISLSDLPAIALDDLSNVNASSPNTNDVLTFNGTWAAAAPAGGGASELDDLSDVTISTPADKEYLCYDGSEWVNAGILLEDLSDVRDTTEGGGVQEGSALVFRNSEGDPPWHPRVPNLGGSPAFLQDVNISNPQDGDRLEYDAGQPAWINVAAGGGGIQELDDLSDVDTTTNIPGQGSILEFDGSTTWNPSNAARLFKIYDQSQKTLVFFTSIAVPQTADTNRNSLEFKASGLGGTPSVGVLGADTDVDLAFLTQGTGEFVWIDGSSAEYARLSDVGMALQSDDAYYLGDPDTDGTWRFIRDGSDLVIQVRESNVYNTKTTIAP